MQKERKKVGNIQLSKIDVPNWVIAVVVVGGLLWNGGKKDANLEQVLANQGVKAQQISTIEGLLTDKNVEIIVIKKDLEVIDYRVSKLEDK